VTTNFFRYLKEQAKDIAYEMSIRSPIIGNDYNNPRAAQRLFSLLFPEQLKKLAEQSINKQTIKEKFEKERDPLLRFKPGQIVCEQYENEINFYKILRNSYILRYDGPDYDYVAVKVHPFSNEPCSTQEELLYDDEDLKTYAEAIDIEVEKLEEKRQELLKSYDKFFELEKIFLAS
jgi:hypothetical protein